ncbi:MAG TPA: tetratricopeptide repeat protein [Thermoanaerobaculia bacterium]|jgi:Flp pilus assembly protein TadD|nr:tetratricopeptide repeat protein [Thermoanaerobaculia bacterium]
MRGRLVPLLLIAALPALAQPPARLDFPLQSRPLRGLQGPIATLLTTGQEGGGLPVAALAVPAGEPIGGKTADGRFAVPVLVEIEGNGLLAQRQSDTQRIEIYAYAMGADGSVHDFLAQGLTVNIAQWGEAILDGGIKFVGSVSMPAGSGSVRVLVVDPDTLRYSLRVLPVTVPSPDGGPLLLQPLFSDPRGRWVLARQSQETPEIPGLAPLLVDDGWGLPSSLPLLAAGRTRRIEVLGRGLPADPAVTLRIRTEFGKTVQEIPGRVVGRTRTSGSAPERLDVDVDLPKLETGRYRAAVVLKDGPETPELTVLYLGEGATDQDLLWAQLRRLSGQEAPPTPAAVPEAQGRGRKRNAEIERIARQGYEEAVRSLASGSPLEQVVERLATIETGLYRQAPQQADEVREVELESARKLGKDDAEALLPIALLHGELYRKLRDGREYLLAENARRTSADLVSVYAERGGSATVAAQALLSLAADLLVSGVQGASRDLLGKALALDARSEAAGLFLAASYERDGDYPKAVEILGGLARVHPESFETRLRLAVNLDRTGKTAEARQAFQKMIAEPGPEWVRTIAYQEMARIHLRDKRPSDAVALLRQAVARLPREPQLAVQLAFLLDRQGNAADARVILDRLPTGKGGSPRNRYGQWPAAALEEARRSLAQQSLLRLAALSRALGSSEAGGR